MFKSFVELVNSLGLDEKGNKKKFIFHSEPKKLRSWNILLQSLASGDFNPAHCRPEFAKKSFFKSIVSHGIGIFARAEGQFVQLLPKYFSFPIEVATSKYEVGPDYHSPLRLGEEYQYRFEITNAQQRRRSCDLTCHIICEVIGPNARVVAEADWKPFLIDHSIDEGAEKALRPKSYLRNVFEILVVNPINWFMERIALGIFAGIAIIVLVGIVLAITGKIELFDASLINDLQHNPMIATAML